MFYKQFWGHKWEKISLFKALSVYKDALLSSHYYWKIDKKTWKYIKYWVKDFRHWLKNFKSQSPKIKYFTN